MDKTFLQAIKYTALALLAFFSVMFVLTLTAKSAEIETDCPWFVPHGAPTVLSDRPHIELCRTGYANYLDLDARVPTWTAYLLDEHKALGCEGRMPFKPDADVPAPFRVKPSDYNAVGFDRGHLVNAADQAWDSKAEADSFLMSNMSPQYPGFNRGIFKNLEDQIRSWAIVDHRSLLIYVGNTWTPESQKIKNSIVIPDFVWKIIIDLNTGEAMAFLLPNQEGLEDFAPYATSIKNIENKAGILIPLPKNTLEDAVLPVWKIVKADRAAEKKQLCSK